MNLYTAATLLFAVSTPSVANAVPWKNKGSLKGGKNNADDDNCPIIDTVECGETYTEGIITLGQDLICNENITGVDKSSNAPITLDGPVVLDCNGHTISQVTESIGSAVECVRSFWYFA